MRLDLTMIPSFPVSALCGLASITTISNVIPVLADYLERHPSAGSFFEDVVPIILVAGLTIAVCPLLLLVANKAETLVCGYQVHNSVLWRNWVFLEINVVRRRYRSICA
jgi:xanthosine utilization system XapX-like protein